MNPIDLSQYQTYRGLPPLAGLATLAEAARPGLGIEACVARLSATTTPSCGCTRSSPPASPPSRSTS